MINKVEFEGFKYIGGGVCAAQGFKANGIQCGLAHKPLTDTEKNTAESNNALPSAKKKNDLAVIIADKECTAAAVYTTNKVKGAPIQVTKSNIADGKARGVIVNSVNANTCNADGVEKAEKMCELVSDQFGLKPSDFIVASTGVIGQVLPIEPIEKGMPELCKGVSYEGNSAAVEAIMTTDTMPKEVAVEFEINGKKCVMGGMLKGSGMIHPNMCTMLGFVTTDAKISKKMLQEALSEDVKDTYNMVSVDGDTSTNDTVLLLANGLAENPEITEKGEDYEIFKAALNYINTTLAKKIAGDGEGATALFEVKIIGAESKEQAVTLSKSVVTSSLTKAAIYGHDANWGRILCAMGYSGAKFDPEKVDLFFESKAGKIQIIENGVAVDYSEEEATKILSEEAVTAIADVKMGDATATAWGCDLTYDYIKINADYRS